MTELSPEYMNAIANQIILVASLLGGFSIAIVANLLTDKTENRITNYIFKTTTLAAGCFLISLFSMTKIAMMTTPGYPNEISSINISIPNLIGSLTFLLGILFLCLVIGLSGWSKTKKMGIFTTIVSVITFILVLVAMADINIG